MPTFGVSDFCKHRHGADSRFTAFYGSWEKLHDIVQLDWERRIPGYREGVVIIPVDLSEDWNTTGLYNKFSAPVVELNENDLFEGSYSSRVPGETPRKTTYVSRVNKLGAERKASTATHIDIILYSKETLAEKDEPRTGADWDVITVLGKLSADSQPMTPGTLMANHFGADGGSNTLMGPVEFEQALRESFDFWKNKGLLAP